jgi:flagellar hook protein FlgE
MSFQQGLSGLNASSKNLDVIGNNISNASTVGFKTSQAQFSDVYAASLSGAGASQIGLGTKVATVVQQFTQGNISATNNPLDVAINGGGFYRLDTNGAITYARNGQFQLDKDRYVVTSAGARLTGYGVDATTGQIVATNPAPLQISNADLNPLATGASVTATGVEAGLNLDSRLAVPITSPFNFNNPNTFNSSTSLTIYDSLGNPHVMSMYFVKRSAVPGGAPAGTTSAWDLHVKIDNISTVAPPAYNDYAPAGAYLGFNNAGQLTTTTPIAIAVPAAHLNNGAAALSYVTNYAGTTQFGSPFGVNTLTQDGYSSGRLNGFNVGKDGVIQGRYSNGQSRNLGQVVLANFPNAQGLKPLGNNEWAETSESNQPLVGIPGSGSLGVLQSAAVEDSNVDLTAELVNMITAQRVYQANAQTIKTQDAVLQTLVNLR